LCFGSLLGHADEYPHDIGEVEIRGAGSITRRVDGHWWQPIESVRGCRQDGGPGGRYEFTVATSEQSCFRIAQDLGYRGGREGQFAVRATGCTRPGGYRRDDHPIGMQRLERSAAPDDVDDRVERPHLVEMDLVHVDAVDCRLGAGEDLERAERALSHARVERGRLEELDDARVGAVRRRVGRVHVRPQRAQPRFARVLEGEFPPLQLKCLE
jgi:hypothetical protein